MELVIIAALFAVLTVWIYHEISFRIRITKRIEALMAELRTTREEPAE